MDLFHAHIGGMDAFARGLKIAAKIVEDGRLPGFITNRYAGWDSDLGRSIESGDCSFADLEKLAHEKNLTAVPSGRQEMLENWLNELLG